MSAATGHLNSEIKIQLKDILIREMNALTSHHAYFIPSFHRERRDPKVQQRAARRGALTTLSLQHLSSDIHPSIRACHPPRTFLRTHCACLNTHPHPATCLPITCDAVSRSVIRAMAATASLYLLHVLYVHIQYNSHFLNLRATFICKIHVSMLPS